MSNINENLEKIQNAIYGEEVRGAIVDSIKQCYDDNAQQGNSNAEVIMSRGNYRTLRERLDSLDYVSFTMQTDQEIARNTDFEVPHEYKLGGEGLIILTEGSKLIKDINYIEIDNLHIRFKDWDVPIGTNLEFICNTNKVMQSDEVYIKELEEENAAFKDLLPFGQKSGENVTLEDSGEIKLKKFRIEGNTWQETREGYNLLNIPKTLAVKTTTYRYANPIPAGTKITISWQSFEKGGENNPAVDFRNSNNQPVNYHEFAENENTYTFTTTEEIIATGVYSNGYSYENSRDTTSTINNLMVIVGDAKPYEEYGITPSREIPSKIKSCENSINFTICNKNLASTDILASKNLQAVTIVSKNEFTIDLSKGSVSALNGADALFGKLDGDKQYVLSYHHKQDNVDFRPYFVFKYTDGTSSGEANGTHEKDIVSISTKNKKIAKIVMGWNTQSAGGVAEFSDIMLREINDSENYVERKEQNFTFPLKQKLFEADYLAKDGIHHKRSQVELDGTESINLETSDLENVNRFRINSAVEAGSRLPKCSHFKYVYDYVADKEHFYIDRAGNIYLFIDKTIASTVAELRAWLAQQKTSGMPFAVNYELGTEQLEEYSEEQKTIYGEIMQTAKSYKEKTHIFGTDSTSAVFNVEYYKDIEAYVISEIKGGAANG